jgi:hypothetical protein
MEGFTRYFEEASRECNANGDSFDNFRHSRNLYGFCINGGTVDLQAINYSITINEELHNKFANQPKSLVGYNGHEETYVSIDDLDSKHILQLTFLFNNYNTHFNKIVEIGGGFGNMCRLCNNIITYNNWDIIDIPHMIRLQRFYLQHELKDISKINFIDATTAVEYNDIDLVIGTHSLSEFSWDIFCDYFQTTISKSKFFYFGYNKNCPSPELINLKLDYINNNGFNLEKKFDYTELPYGANVCYSLYKNSILN